MRSSDVFSLPELKVSADGVDEFESPMKNSQLAWTAMSREFLNNISYTEQNIHTEIQLELIRKEMQEKGILSQERIETKTYENEYTIKHSLLRSISCRLRHICDVLRNNIEKDKKIKYIIDHHHKKEYMHRRDNQLVIHIHKNVFLPITTVLNPISLSYITGVLYYNGVEYTGYITEEELPGYKEEISQHNPKNPPDNSGACSGSAQYSEEVAQDLFESTDPAELVRILPKYIFQCRDRLNSSEILQEHFCGKNRIKVERRDVKPDITLNNKKVIFILCAMKEGSTFKKSLDMMKDKGIYI
ncbi:hypothetical protein NEPAR04_1925 [Nematocida parisii]|uniref:Uncharacterized protein n=1 Tax=Nematocida parisii (strain ERTm3) TaxID=935791 RepID=I3EDP7_NEMP3|nr:hypothetical protein NEQG_02467 [Nematocida parisii ERTm3]KAI5129229.1 hypothetical protein NEPAR08_1523 [Nematocida parisii]KAI5130162.1 hypothetical protein NEPAR03_1983 [Nematocida parisii]KAI5143729.1 hypothetical protein NEPAR04_1925 [Nematocida parisii]KAI5143887.1 hypothetical protein NEPAR07_0936 [Nematocida parisii]